MPVRNLVLTIPGGTAFYPDSAVPYELTWLTHRGTLEEGVHSGLFPKTMGKSKTGGSFDVRTNSERSPPVGPYKVRPDGGTHGNLRLEGMFMCQAERLPDWYLPYPNDPESFGAEAYAKMKPTKPVFPGLNALYELRDVPGMLRQRFLDSGLNRIGDYYLALKFGWEPLLRDVRNLVNTQRTAQTRLKQLLRDNGRAVRRRIILRKDIDEPNVYDAEWYQTVIPAGTTYFYRRKDSVRVTQYRTDHIWASAQMRYWLPDGPRDIAWKRRMLARLYGLTPTPSVIYNMVPWSWMADWFTNAGDVISNMDAGVADRLAADWFYVMRQRELIVKREAIKHTWDMTGNPIDISCSAVSIVSRKARVEGDPFGFATRDVDLSRTQLAILGALGLSRLR